MGAKTIKQNPVRILSVYVNVNLRVLLLQAYDNQNH